MFLALPFKFGITALVDLANEYPLAIAVFVLLIIAPAIAMEFKKTWQRRANRFGLRENAKAC